jgi:hypothetical protein
VKDDIYGCPHPFYHCPFTILDIKMCRCSHANVCNVDILGPIQIASFVSSFKELRCKPIPSQPWSNSPTILQLFHDHYLWYIMHATVHITLFCSLACSTTPVLWRWFLQML